MNHPLVAVLSSKTPTQPEPTAELPLTSLRRIWGCCTLVPNHRLLWWGRSSVRTLSESWRSHPPSSSALRPVEKRQNTIFRMGKTTVSREPFLVYSYYVGHKGIVHPKLFTQKCEFVCACFFTLKDSAPIDLHLYDWRTVTVWVKNLCFCSTEETKYPTSWMSWG